MRTFNITYEDIIDYDNLCGANIDAKKCKTERNEVMRFNMELDENLLDLHDDLVKRRYKQRGYRLIYITVPKKRLIMALQYRDRVLQWAIYRKLNPLYEKIYIEDSYGCRKEKGRSPDPSPGELQNTIQGMIYQVVNFNRLHRNRRRSSRGSFNRDRLSACSWASLCPAPVSFSSQEGCFARRWLASRLQAVCIQGTVATANRTPAITQTPANPSRI